jgi:putative salt-induced outer membrane protein YdiY
MDPSAWSLAALWNKSFELGINGSEGNANAFSLRTGVDFSRETELTNWDVALTYRKAVADGMETQHNALLYSDLDLKLTRPRWSWFNKFGLEYDEFKAFNLRVNYNTGFGYLLIDAPLTQLRPRFGAGTSHEIGGPDDTWKPEADFGFDFSKQFTPYQKFSIVCDYYPNWTNFSDFRAVTVGSWEFILNESHNLSLALGLIDRYDSTPNSAKPHDVDYSVLLIWAK